MIVTGRLTISAASHSFANPKPSSPSAASTRSAFSIVRSMSTREADHNRGKYYMHTGYVPNPNIEHPSYGAVISHELIDQRPDLQIPPFVSVGGGSVGPGFLGMAWAPFNVDSNGNVRNLQMGLDESRLKQRMEALALIEKGFISENRGEAAKDHAKILDKTLSLMTSPQMEAFKVAKEPQEVKDRYGTTGFAQGLLMARRLREVGVPFVEVDLGGWDNHQDIFPTLADTKLPELDKAMSALVEDISASGLLADTAVIWMGEFSRTPRINGNAGRDHWGPCNSVVMAGGGVPGGQVFGASDPQAAYPTRDKVTQDDIAAEVGKDRATVANYLRLLKLPEEVRANVASGALSMGHARAIVALASDGDQRRLRD